MSLNLVNLIVLHVPGAIQMTLNDINDDGRAVGQFTDAAGGAHGFVYKDGAFSQIDYPQSTSTNALGINNAGKIVGVFTTAVATSGFLFDQGTFTPPIVIPGSANSNIANRLNDRDDIVGLYQTSAGADQGFLYRVGQFRTIVFPGVRETVPLGINNSGQIVGIFPDVHGTHGFVYLQNPGVFTGALNLPRATGTLLRAVNNAGQIVGGSMDPSGNEHPFAYTGGSAEAIVVPNATSVSINGINDRGQIVGNGQFPGGQRSFIATIAL